MTAERSNTALVTGATGFVGRRLCRALLDRGVRVVAGLRAPASAARLPVAVESCVVGEIGPETDWSAARLHEVDAVYHLAARVHQLDDRAADPEAEFRRVNTLGSAALARAAAEQGVRRLVYVSSVHAMCTLADDVLREDTPCRPTTPYGRSKLAAEEALREIGASDRLEVVILRPPPVYGPGHLGNLSRLLQIAQRGWPLPLGGIANRRSLVYVDNLVDALIAAAEHPAAAGQTFLVSDGDDVSISQLIETATRAAGRKAHLLPAPQRLMRFAAAVVGKRGAAQRLFGSLAVDDGKLRRTLSWRPRISLEEGLISTVRSMRKSA